MELNLLLKKDKDKFKPTTCLKDLIKAGTLIAATIDRLQND